MRSFSFPDGQQRVKGGCAVLVERGELDCPFNPQDDSDEFAWTAAQTAAFMAGEPLTLGWVSQSPVRADSGGAYICCWVTIDSE
jgi:hypothetical protein